MPSGGSSFAHCSNKWATPSSLRLGGASQDLEPVKRCQKKGGHLGRRSRSTTHSPISPMHCSPKNSFSRRPGTTSGNVGHSGMPAAPATQHPWPCHCFESARLGTKIGASGFRMAVPIRPVSHICVSFTPALVSALPNCESVLPAFAATTGGWIAVVSASFLAFALLVASRHLVVRAGPLAGAGLSRHSRAPLPVAVAAFAGALSEPL
mmetsp:Transcript_29240/g.57250  ORF Transcript_29240/g.57250 Transcript_29240/m.57250 type:complete len:208 (-) Transcript_29240:545-1168(-)